MNHVIYIVDYFKIPKMHIHVRICIFLCIYVSECTTYTSTQITLVCWRTHSSTYQELTATMFYCLDLSSADRCAATQAGRQSSIASGGKKAIAGYVSHFEPVINHLVNRPW